MGSAICPSCRATGLSESQIRDHVARHGARSFERVTAREARGMLRRMPRSHPAYPWLRLMATDRFGISDDVRLAQNLEAICEVLDRGGDALVRAVFAACPEEAESVVSLADRTKPEFADRLRALVPIREPVSP